MSSSPRSLSLIAKIGSPMTCSRLPYPGRHSLLRMGTEDVAAATPAAASVPSPPLDEFWQGKAPSDAERAERVEAMLSARKALDQILARSSSSLPAGMSVPEVSDSPCLTLTDAHKALGCLREGGKPGFHASLREAFRVPRAAAGGTPKWSPPVRVPLKTLPRRVLQSAMASVLPPRPAGAVGESVPASLTENLTLHLEDLAGTASTELAWTEAEDVADQLRQGVQRLDRVMPPAKARDHAETVMEALGRCLGAAEGTSAKVLQRVFDLKAVVVPRRVRRHVRIRFGVQAWGPSYFGLGCYVECFERFELRDELDQPEGPLATLLCGCSYAVALRGEPDDDRPSDTESEGEGQGEAPEGEEEEEYADAASEPSRVHVSLSRSFLSLRLRLEPLGGEDAAVALPGEAAGEGLDDGEGKEGEGPEEEEEEVEDVLRAEEERQVGGPLEMSSSRADHVMRRVPVCCSARLSVPSCGGLAGLDCVAL
jgi:hypothetical protein